jgi:hypothetical protein
MPAIDAALPLVLLMALVLAAALHGLAASGHFPAQHRAPALASGAGAAILYGTMAVAAAALVAGIAGAWRAVLWPAAVIGGGGMVLAAPLVLRIFSDRFVDGRAALVIFAGAAAGLAVLMLWAVRASGG